MEIFKHYSKPVFSLGKYTGSQCNTINDDEYIFEAHQVGLCSYYKDGDFEMTLYHNGIQEDFEINGWAFSGFNKGVFHSPGSYSSMSLAVEATDRNGVTGKIWDHLSSDMFGTEVAGVYMNIVMESCIFDSITDVWDIKRLENDGKSFPLQKSISVIKNFNESIAKMEKNDTIPESWKIHSRKRYLRILETFKASVSKEDLLDALFPEIKF